VRHHDNDDEESKKSPQEIFGKNCAFIMSRIYRGKPKWNSLFEYWTTLYGNEKLNIFCCSTKSTTKEVRKTCKVFNGNGFNFHFRHESSH
jgi:hypothetical protein